MASLRSCRPRRVSGQVGRPFVLLTDGACEPAQGGGGVLATVGAVLRGPGLRGPAFFGCAVEDPLLASWRAGGKDQLVGQAEILPVVLALSTWGDVLRGGHVLAFVDNDAARFSLIGGYSPVRESAALIGLAGALAAELEVSLWFERVSSAANLADEASRLDFGRLRRWPGSRQWRPRFRGRPESIWHDLASATEGRG